MMIVLLVTFTVLAFTGTIVWAISEKWGLIVGRSLLVIALLVLLTPTLVQKAAVTYDKMPVESFRDAEVYYSESEGQYYAITSEENWKFWDLYDEVPISENLLKERQNDKNIYKNLFIES